MENLLGQFFSVSESPQAVVDDVIALYELKKDILSFDLHTSITHPPLSGIYRENNYSVSPDFPAI